jgi:hypothetical protein
MAVVRKLIISTVMALAAISASAVTAYTNFGSISPGFNLNTGMAIVGPTNSFGYVEQGSLFTSSASGALSEIVVAAQRYAGPNYLSISLYRDVNGAIGELLTTSTTSTVLPGLGSSALASFTGFSDVSLFSGSQYWLMARTIDDASIGWMLTSKPTFDSVAYRYSPTGSWTYVPTEIRQITRETPGVFSVSVSPIPEPSQWLLLLVGSFALGAHVMRRS